MAGTFYYVAYDNGWTVNLGTTAVRLGSLSGFTELAEMGAVGTSTVVVDDTTGTAGHSSDGFLAYQQFFLDEGLATIARVFAGWTKSRRYYRGSDSLRTGVMRKIEIALEDGNTLAGRRLIWPKASDSTVNRPSETAAARISWLLGTAYFSGVADHGLVHPATITLSANDYSTHSPADVMNDCCVATGDNWFVYWDRTAAAWSLAVFNMTTYNGYVSTLKLSNDRSLIDSSITGGAGISNCWAIEEDAVLTRDPMHVATEEILPYAKGTAIQTTTSATYPVISQVAPSTSVKTLALANAQALRILNDNGTEADRITCSAKIAAANVNDALPGQQLYANFTHFPTYTAQSPFRIVGRTVSQVEPSDQFALVNFQLVPAAPVSPQSSFATVYYPREDHDATTAPKSAVIQWAYNGDAPGSTGYSPNPKYGLMAYDATGSVYGGTYKTGIKMTGAGTDVEVFVECCWQFAYDFGAPAGGSMRLDLLKNGASIANTSVADTGSGLHSFAGSLSIDQTAITVVSGDIFTAKLTWTVTPHISSIPSAGTFGYPYLMWASGTLS